MHATHPSSPLRLAALSAMMAVIGLTACGGGDDDPAPSPPAPAPTPAPTPSPAPAANIVPTSITLLAGGGLGSAGDCGDANGVADQARLGQAMDMAVAPDGTVHMLEKVCDGSGLTRVRSVSPTGQVTTPAVASREPVVPGGPLVSFRNGRSLAVGDDGTVYLSDGNESFLLFPSYHQQGPATGIWTLTPTGAQPFAGLRTWSLQPADGTGLQAQFLSVGRLVFGQGALFVHDYPDVIRRVTRDAQVTTVTTTLQMPSSITADNAGVVYYNNGAGMWQRLDGTGGIPIPSSGEGTSASTISSDGAVYATVRSRTRMYMDMYRYAPDGSVARIASQLPGQPPTWDTVPTVDPQMLDLDRAGNLYLLHGYKLWRIAFK